MSPASQLNFRCSFIMTFLRRLKSRNERLVSWWKWRWWRQELKVDWEMWLNYFEYSEETVSGVCRILSTGSLPSLFRGAHKVGGLGYHHREIFQNQPHHNRRRKTAAAAVVGKNVTRRRVSRIILPSVANVSSRLRWGLETSCSWRAMGWRPSVADWGGWYVCWPLRTPHGFNCSLTRATDGRMWYH